MLNDTSQSYWPANRIMFCWWDTIPSSRTRPLEDLWNETKWVSDVSPSHLGSFSVSLLSGMWHPSSLTRDWACVPCNESMESPSVDFQGIPLGFCITALTFAKNADAISSLLLRPIYISWDVQRPHDEEDNVSWLDTDCSGVTWFVSITAWWPWEGGEGLLLCELKIRAIA